MIDEKSRVRRTRTVRRQYWFSESEDVLLGRLADARLCSRSDILRYLIVEESRRLGLAQLPDAQPRESAS